MKTFRPVATLLMMMHLGVPALWGQPRQETVWDMSMPLEDQTGDYRAEGLAVLRGGVATLEAQPSPPWLAGAVRVMVVLRGPSQDEVPVMLDLAGLPEGAWDHLGSGGIQATGPDGVTALPTWVEWRDGRAGQMWVQLPQLRPTGTRIYLYLGVPGGGSDEAAVFLYSDMRPLYWLVSSLLTGTDLELSGLAEGNEIAYGASALTLGPGERGVLPGADLTACSAVLSRGAFEAAGAANGTETLAPLTYGGTSFVTYAGRDGDRFFICGLGPAQVVISSGGVELGAFDLLEGQGVEAMTDIVNGEVAIITATAPVLIEHVSDTGGDGYLLHPASLDLYGFPSSSAYIGAMEEGTEVQVYGSDGLQETHALGAGQSVRIAGASAFGGPALHLVANHPIGAIQQADGAGGDSTSFLPGAEMGSTFVLPRATNRVALVSSRPLVSCRVESPDGAVLLEGVMGALEPPAPNMLVLGAAAAGSLVRCTGPVLAYMDDTATSDEKTLHPPKAARPVGEPAVEVVMGSVEMPFGAGSGGTVTTPSLEPGGGVAALWDLTEGGVTAVPEGARVGYLLSPDGGVTWMAWQEGAWGIVMGDHRGAVAAEMAEGLSSFPLAGLGRLTVRLVLTSEDGLAVPSLDDLILGYSSFGELTRLEMEAIANPQYAGLPFTLVVRAFDEHGSLLRSLQARARLEDTSATLEPTMSQPFVEGVLRQEVTVSQITGGDVITAQVSSLSVSSNPFDVIISQARRLEAAGGEGQRGEVGSLLAEPLQALVTDAGGNPVSSYPVNFYVLSGGGQLSGGPLVLTDRRGVAQLEWTLGPGAGVNEVSAQAPDLEGSPVIFTAEGLPGAVDLALSAVLAEPSIVLADGRSEALITVQPADRFGNPVGPGLNVVVEAQGGQVGAVMDQGDGGYRALLTSMVPGLCVVTAFVEGVELTNQGRVTFVQADGGIPDGGERDGGGDGEAPGEDQGAPDLSQEDRPRQDVLGADEGWVSDQLPDREPEGMDRARPDRAMRDLQGEPQGEDLALSALDLLQEDHEAQGDDGASPDLTPSLPDLEGDGWPPLLPEGDAGGCGCQMATGRGR